ncbi:MBL fold metallo-hydrolase [Frankia sp. AgB1.9]|nr:MBL fold metallo-hydrolase [Frankia sp. AgB1.9]
MAVTVAGDPAPTLVLDAGTGLRNLGPLLGQAPFRGTILLTHLHWDHTQGLPFAPGLDRPDASVELRVPAQRGRSAARLLSRSMSPPSFPIEISGLRGQWRTRLVHPGTLTVGPRFTVRAAEVPHKGGRTFGYRVTADGACLAYLPDHALAGRPTAEARALATGADLLLHDASNGFGDRAAADAYGHSTMDDAIRFARACQVRRLVLIHHGPGRTDTDLDALAAQVAVAEEGGDLLIGLGREGDVIPCGQPAPAAVH